MRPPSWLDWKVFTSTSPHCMLFDFRQPGRPYASGSRSPSRFSLGPFTSSINVPSSNLRSASVLWTGPTRNLLHCILYHLGLRLHIPLHDPGTSARPGQHPAKPAAFLVEGHQADSPDQPPLPVPGWPRLIVFPSTRSTAVSPTRPSRGQPEAARPCRSQPPRHGRRRENLPAALDAATEGMTEVEELSRASLGRVLRHHVHLHVSAGGDHRGVHDRPGTGRREGRQERRIRGSRTSGVPLRISREGRVVSADGSERTACCG